MNQKQTIGKILAEMSKIYERSPIKDEVCTCYHLENEHDGGGCWLCSCSVFRSYNKVQEFVGRTK